MKGGVANYYYNLIQALPEDRFFVLDNAEGELLYRTKLIWPKWLKGLFTTWNVIRRKRIDHVLVGQVLPIGTITWILSHFTGIRYTVMTHAMDVTLLMAADANPRKKWLLQRILANATAVTTVSDFTKQKLITVGVPEEKIKLVYPCPHSDGTSIFDSEKKRYQKAIDEQYGVAGKTVLLTVARLHERKGIDVVLSALDTIRNQHENVVYVIVGDGPFRRELEQIVRVRNLSDSVIFTGAISDKEVSQWFARANIFAMISRELDNGDVEGFGIVYLEANSYGVPVVAGNSGGVPDAVIDGETGFLVDPQDKKMVAEAISALVTNPVLAATLGNNGLKRVEAQFRWSHQAETLKSVTTSH